MKKIGETGSTTMKWTQPKMAQRVYELHAGKELVGTLRWDRTADHEAVGETADGSWSFERKGLLRPTITARSQESKQPAGVLEVAWSGGGTLKLPGGPELRWLPSNFWRSQWAFAKADGGPVVTFKPDSLSMTAGAHVELAPGNASISEVPLLVVLGWYMLVLILEDSAIIGA